MKNTREMKKLKENEKKTAAPSTFEYEVKKVLDELSTSPI